ncbi:MAG: aspartate aminotransferase family protein [bacterium]|nr:aspartate aminotransferase family protein [bacterium]
MPDLKTAIHESYTHWSPNSAQLIEEARRCFPGGDTRMSAHYAPYPLFIERAEGSRLFDADGHELIDFMNNYTSLILGHANPKIVDAVSEQMARGSAYAAPTRSQVDLARLIRERVPSVEQLRFTSSGTEATLMTLRCARAFSGRGKIMKMEGGYHGSYELAEVSLAPLPGLAGPLDAPQPVPIDRSHSESVLGDVVICPYNEPERARALIERHAHELAAVIVEPVLGSMGMIPATREFLQTLRETTRDNDVLLIFDEVISLRLAPGGAQALQGVIPDLTAMGKIIGGGLPIGAFGGSEELMRVFHPDERQPVMHASTFSGNPLSMAAGAATLPQVDDELTRRIDALGVRLREGFDGAFARQGVRGRTSGIGSLSNVHLTDSSLDNPRDSIAGMVSSRFVNGLLHLLMLQRGIASASRLMYCTSAAMNESDVDRAIDALDDALVELKPGLQREMPHLLI